DLWEHATYHVWIPCSAGHKIGLRVRTEVKQTSLLIHHIIHGRYLVSGAEQTLAQHRTEITSNASDEDMQIHGLAWGRYLKALVVLRMKGSYINYFSGAEY